MKKIASVEGLSTNALLRLFGFIKSELWLRQYRHPVGDRAVWLIERYFGGKRMKPTNKGFDLLLPDGRRVEVKARCIMSPLDGTRILASDIRCLEGQQFDVLAMVVFHSDLSVARALLIPYEVVRSRAYYSRHSNAWRFYYGDDLLKCPGVKEITREIAVCEADERKRGTENVSLVLSS